MSEAAQTCHAAGETIIQITRGHEVLNRIDCADRDGFSHGGKSIHFCPEMDGVAQLALGDLAKPVVGLAENERQSFGAHGVAIAFENRIANAFLFQHDVSRFDGQMRAYGEADQIVGVGHGIGFVEIVDAPDEAAFRIAPGAEILDVQVAYREQLRTLGEFGTDLGPELRPAVVGGAQKREDRSLHVAVLRVQISLDDVGAMAEPVFKVAGSLTDVHSGKDSEEGNASQRRGGRTRGPEGAIASLTWTSTRNPIWRVNTDCIPHLHACRTLEGSLLLVCA